MALNIDEMEEYVKKVNEILESKNLEKESDLRNIFGVIRNHAREVRRPMRQTGALWSERAPK